VSVTENVESVEDVDDDVEEVQDLDGPGGSGPWWRRGRGFLAFALTVVLLVAGGCGFLYRSHQLRDVPAARNHALTDTETTARVAGDVSNALGKVFSYTPEDTGVTAKEARELLAGKAAKQYTELFGQVGTRAEQQRLTLTTQVVRAGVVTLEGGEAHLLVFLDQTAQRKGKAAGAVAAQLSVTAELRDGSWLITDIKAR
jgi:Mce-associated membrane protein